MNFPSPFPSRLRDGRTARRPSFAGESDADLLHEFINGSNAAIEELVTRHDTRLFLYCNRILSSADAAWDAVQDTWGRILQMREGRHPTHDNVVGMILHIARNICVDELRASGQTVSLDDVDENDLPFIAEPRFTDIEEAVQAALDRLPFSLRNIHKHSECLNHTIAVTLNATSPVR